MSWNLSEERDFRTWRFSCRKLYGDDFFSQWMPPPLWLGFCAPPAWGDTKQEHHLTALPCAGHICRQGFAFSRWQEASVAAVTLSEGPAAHQGAPRVDYTVFMAVLRWCSTIKIREHREGLRPMDCSSLPSSRDNFNPSKCIKQIWVVRIDTHTELSFPSSACLAVLCSSCTCGKVWEEGYLIIWGALW